MSDAIQIASGRINLWVAKRFVAELVEELGPLPPRLVVIAMGKVLARWERRVSE